MLKLTSSHLKLKKKKEWEMIQVNQYSDNEIKYASTEKVLFSSFFRYYLSQLNIKTTKYYICLKFTIKT